MTKECKHWAILSWKEGEGSSSRWLLRTRQWIHKGEWETRPALTKLMSHLRREECFTRRDTGMPQCGARRGAGKVTSEKAKKVWKGLYHGSRHTGSWGWLWAEALRAGADMITKAEPDSVKAPNYKDWENEKNEEMPESEIKAVSWDHRDRNAPWEKVKNAALPWGGWRRAKSVLRTKTKPNARLCGKESRKWGRKKKAWKTARWAEGPVTGASFKTWLGGNCLLSRLLVNRGAQVILRTLRHCVLQRPRS